jgi:hypothetical protein
VQIKANKRKQKAFICFHLFFRIGTFQWVTGEKNHFKSDLVSGCVSNVSSALVVLDARAPRRAIRSDDPKGVAHNSDYRKTIRPTTVRGRFGRIRLNASGPHR